MRTALVLGGGGFIGGHLAKALKDDGFFVRVADIKSQHEHWHNNQICDEYLPGDLRHARFVEDVFSSPSVGNGRFDEVYQLAADMGGAGYIFTGENDANVMHGSALINLNVVHQASSKGVGRLFYSSSACMYPEHNQQDPDKPNCVESSAYPANPDSEYGWEKLFSERLFAAFGRNYGLTQRVARYHNIFGPRGTWNGGKEKAPAAMCRKAIEATDHLEVWGDGKQTRSFLYIEECIKATLSFMRQDDFEGPVNIGSEEMVTINELAQLAINLTGKNNVRIKNIFGEEFKQKYGFDCPIGVMGRNSDNALYKEKMGWSVSSKLSDGMENTYKWIASEMAK